MRTAAILPCLLLAACEEAVAPEHVIPDADPERGAAIIAEVGCGACHVIPGIPAADGTVGPPLTAFGRRAYVAGRAPNVPEHLVNWLMDPPAVDPRTAMPSLGLDRAQARDVAAYLYTLR